MLEVKEKRFMLGDKEIIIKTGEYALQANGSITIQCGETIIHVAVVMSKENPDLDFFPLSVEYIEHLYAGGIIKSSRFVKREGRPSDESIMKARLIDRSIRPFFPKDFRRDVQVAINILTTDNENPHDVLALTGVIAALAISDIPFDSHIGGIRLSKVDGELVVNPTYEQCEKQDFELVLAGNEERIAMIECASQCISDDIIEDAFEKSYSYLGVITKAIDEFKSEVGKAKVDFTVKEVNEEIYNKIKQTTEEKIEEYYNKMASGQAGKSDFPKIVKEPVISLFNEEEIEEYGLKQIEETLDKIFKKKVRENILKDKRRVDGRSIEDVREIQIKVSPLPRVHGSSMFMRGGTQVLNILTLASLGNEQIMESLEGESKKYYIHHYSAPPYSVGETGRYGSPGRREIGHGGLAEKALIPVLPDKEEFPYVMRLVSEVMGQNGSSSMASTCASCITLMSGGVPIKEPVAGISIGLMTGESVDEFITLTDIRGIEDFSGDMDFKVAGTREGITAIQMDTKIKGLTFAIVKQALKQAKEARIKILDIIKEAIPNVKGNLSKYAPKVSSFSVPEDMISKVIGSGGKVIKQIQSEYEVDISIDDDGIVSISGSDNDKLEAVKTVIKGIVTNPKVGTIYKGKVVKILDFGAKVEIFPGKVGLVHISNISQNRINKVEDVLSLDQIVDVKLYEVDHLGRLNFTMNLDKVISTRNQHKHR